MMDRTVVGVSAVMRAMVSCCDETAAGEWGSPEVAKGAAPIR
jgi:hypothetical protein